MKKFILGALVCALSIGTLQTAYADPGGKNVKVVATKMDKSRGANPEIKGGKPTTDKPAEKSRGTCTVNFRNHTGYYIDVYMDGYFWGTLSPYASGSVTDGSGYTKIYCETAGKTYHWSAEGNCSEPYNYDLYVN